MTRAKPDWAYAIDNTGRHWYHLSNGHKKPTEEKGFRPPSKALFAIPTNDIVSIPQWVSSKDFDIIDEFVALEAERLGFRSNDGPGRVSEWKAIELDDNRTLVQLVTIPWNLPELESTGDLFVEFVPQYSLYTPPPNSIVLWTEDGDWIAGYSRGTRWVHVHALGQGNPEALTREIQLTLLELSAKGIVESLDEITVWDEFDADLNQALDQGTGRKVTFVPRPSPADPAEDWDFLPHTVSQSRENDAKRRRGSLIASITILTLVLLVTAALFNLWTLKKSNIQLRSKIQSNRLAADEIQLSIDKWFALAPAFDAKLSPLELFHQVAILLPEKGFRLTSFEIQNSNTVIVRGEGATMANALKIVGDIEKATGLAAFSWDIPPPVKKSGLVELVATGTYQIAGNEEE